MATEARNVSAEPQQRSKLLQVSWQSITEPGAYAELGSGDLYRIPKEALLEGSSPLIRKESSGSSTLMQVSKNPFITTIEARMICCEHNIVPNF